MAVLTSSDVLRTLHRMHRQLEDLRHRIAAGPKAIMAHSKQLDVKKTTHATVQDDIKQARLRADEKQLQLRTSETKILELKGKLNTCKTNKEYQLLTDQIAADSMATQVLEDEILDSLEEVDRVQATLPAAEQAVQTATTLLEETKTRVAAESKELETEVDRILNDLAAAEKDLTGDARSMYDRSVKHKGADAMTAVDGESCGGCYHQITGKMTSDLLLGQVVLCRSCGRLIYAPESHNSST